MATVTLDPAPNRDQPGAPSWVRWFNQLYQAVQTMLSGGSFTTPTLTDPTLAGAVSVTGSENLAAGVPLAFQKTGGTATERLYNDGAGNLTLDASTNGTAWTNALRVATDASLTLNGATTAAGALTVSGAATFSTAANLTFGSNWQSWTPTVTGGGSMTVSAVTVGSAQYLRIGPVVHFSFNVALTLGGTASNFYTVSLPVANAGPVTVAAGGFSANNTNFSPAFTYVQGAASLVVVQLAGGGNFTLGANQAVYVSGMYRAA